ncbi:MAG: helix-turn-helix domain-containing protein [Lachnospiraceae bacterium]|nr:helix-turn-helix domain-containing protein [Lachnospiraceae bacterium]
MSKSAYESIMRGLKEIHEDLQRETPKLKRNTITIEPVREYSADEVKQIRKSVGMSQTIFASYFGVSNKTIEAWEAGTNHPSGPASRILSMIEKDKDIVNKFPFAKSTL